MAANYSFTGWTSQTAAPSTLASRVINPIPQFNTESSVGPVNAVAQTPVTADLLKTIAPTDLKDKTLGSRAYMNPGTGLRDAPIVASAYAQPNTPAFLQESINSLNANQSMRRAQQAEWIDKLFNQAQGGDYMAWEALRAASVQPGAKASFGSAIADPLVAKTQAAQSKSTIAANTANAALAGQQARAMKAGQDMQAEITSLSEERDSLMNSIQAPHWTDRIAGLNNQIMELKQRSRSATASSQGASGWVGAPTVKW
jgi:hypothetical protein